MATKKEKLISGKKVVIGKDGKEYLVDPKPKKTTKKEPTKAKKATQGSKKKKTNKTTQRKKKTPQRKKQAKKDVVITSPIHENQKIVVASELADDNMIEAELMGEVLPHYIYQFSQKGQTISGLSVKGVHEVTRRLNRNPKSGYKITFSPEYMRVERDVEYDGKKGVEVTILAENLIDGSRAWGIKFEPYKKTGKNGSYENTFAVEKALSKAERNAKRKLIPETVATKMIEKLINEDSQNVKRIDAPSYRQKTAEVQKQTSSTPKEIFEIAMEALDFAEKQKDVGNVITISDRAEGSQKLTSEQKQKIKEKAVRIVDSLDQ